MYAPELTDEDFAIILDKMKKIVSTNFDCERLRSNNSLDPEPDVIAANAFHLVVIENENFNGLSLKQVQDQFRRWFEEHAASKGLDTNNHLCLVVDSVSARSILNAPEPSVDNATEGPTTAKIRVVDGQGDEFDEDVDESENGGFMECYVVDLPDLYNSVVQMMLSMEELRPGSTTAGELPVFEA